MRDQLIRYVDLLFAGAPDAGDVKQEILQNTLDRYDDLIAQGKQPEAAYSLAISGIGDINEILSSESVETFSAHTSTPPAAQEKPLWKKILRALSICMYIMCPIPLFVLSELGMDTVGLCGTLCLVAVATALIIISGGKGSPKEEKSTPTPQSELRRAVRAIIWAIGICAYLALSVSLNAWYITWVIFPISAAVQGIVIACLDTKERQGSKAEPIVRIMIFSIVVLLLLGVLLTGLGIGSFTMNLDMGTSGSFISGSSTVNAEDVEDLSIEWASGFITIQTADTDSITFSEEGYAIDGQEMVYTLNNGKLTISYSKPSFQIGFVSIPKKDLTITVPRSWHCGKLDIDSASTDARIEGLICHEVELDSASNTFRFLNCSIATLNVDGASNSIEMTGVVDCLDCDGMSTSIKAVLEAEPSLIDMDGMSGTLDLTLPEDCGFQVTMDGLSNDFSSDFTTVSSDGSYVYGDGSCRIDVDGMSSNVIIRNREKSCSHIWDEGICFFCGAIK